MKVLLCIDDNGGMLFNHRRVSSDRAVTTKVNEIAENRLFITEYSHKLFPDACVVDEGQIPGLGNDDCIFVENVCLAPVIDMISELIIFRWNRRYPSDFCLDIIPEDFFTLVCTEEFEGNSHDKVTKEVWKK